MMGHQQDHFWGWMGTIQTGYPFLSISFTLIDIAPELPNMSHI